VRYLKRWWERTIVQYEQRSWIHDIERYSYTPYISVRRETGHRHPFQVLQLFTAKRNI
jgi:hypothetical protein